MSAVRNLNDTEVGGRPLRVDLADSDPFLEGKSTSHGEILDSSETRSQWRERERASGGSGKRTGPPSFLDSLPQGVPLPPGTSALDAISSTLATMSPAQLTEVLAQMKVIVFLFLGSRIHRYRKKELINDLRTFVPSLHFRVMCVSSLDNQAFVITHPEQARVLLVAHPQFAYALFQAMLLQKIVDPTILQVSVQLLLNVAHSFFCSSCLRSEESLVRAMCDYKSNAVQYFVNSQPAASKPISP